jgi:hypothetical protein
VIGTSGFSVAPKLGNLQRLFEDLAQGAASQDICEGCALRRVTRAVALRVRSEDETMKEGCKHA